MIIKRPEILSPAGNFEKLKFAILYGADAVYISGKSFGMRTAPENFTNDELCEAIEYAHQRNVKIYVTVNIFPHEYERKELINYLEYLASIRPDALIVADMGVLMLAKEYAKDIPIHISTQANTQNSDACRLYYSLGVKRIVMSREITLAEIEQIRKSIPEDMEIETFVHGAMCISHSGRCLLSNYFVGRDANHGACAQSCRWEYNSSLIADVTEVKRPETHLTAIENNRGTFIFSSKDLCMIEHIPDLCRAEISSFKIEGRVKSAYYTAITTNTYKRELEKYLHDPENYFLSPDALSELNGVSHREYCTGYFYTHPLDEAQTTKTAYLCEKAFLATVEEYDKANHRALLFQRNKAVCGNYAELVSPGMSARKFKLENMRDTDGNPIESSPHPQMLFYIDAPFEMKKGDIIRDV